MTNKAGKKRIAPWNDDPRGWYQLEIWRRRRRYQLMLHPVCAMCEKNGLAVAATVADHIENHNGDWFLFLNSPLQSLCKPCHDSDKRFKDINGYERITFGADGWPIDEPNISPSGDVDDALTKKAAGRRVSFNGVGC